MKDRVMPRPDISLTPDEEKLFDAIELDPLALDYEKSIANGERVVALMKSLFAREGIPEVRIKYFTDPDYRTGRRKGSRRDLFRRNGHDDDSMMRHPHFLEYLRYFVCGPDLPTDALRAFRDEAARFGTISSDDVIPLAKFARRETRERGLAPHDACEEYFKLALDCGVWVSYAFMVRDQVKSIK